MRPLTIVMYHYVRDMKRTKYPQIKALDVSEFATQLGRFAKEYQVVRMEQVFEALATNTTLPDNAMLLTFDDGYLDHYESVLPLLKKHDFQGSFFPPVEVITDRKIIDVNKIHYILASAPIAAITKKLFSLVANYRKKYEIPEDHYFYTHSAEKHRFDSPETMLVKRMLQRDLPEKVRHLIVSELFSELVAEDEQAFADQLYMRKGQLKELVQEQMHIGVHGYSHRFLTHLSKKELEQELDLSLQFLNSLGVNTNQWSICYPYGFYNEMVIEMVKKKNCTLGLSIEVGVADLDIHSRFSLPRLDTNDFR